MRFSLLLLFALTACQTAQEKREQVVSQRVKQFKALAHFAPMRCLVMANLTEPARARYREMFPTSDIDGRALTYDYRVSQTKCEITPMEPSALSKNYQSFLQTAFCVLLQAHWVNSPFEGLEYEPKDLEETDGPKGARTQSQTQNESENVKSKNTIHVKSTGQGALGLYINPDELEIETRTKSRGTLRAQYASGKNLVVPQLIEQRQQKSIFRLDAFKLDAQRGGARPLLRSFDISIAEKAPRAQSHVDLTDCRLDQ